MAKLAGKVALVTGGTRGIGLAIVKAFAAEGARVAFSGTTAKTVAAAHSALGDNGQCKGIVADLSQSGAPRSLVESAIRQFGDLDVLVNNAGVISTANEWDLMPEEWDRLHHINVRAVFFASQSAAKAMRSRGGGSIINVSSIAGQSGGIAGSPAYASTKAAVIGITRSLARRLASSAIRVNCISPADIETDMTAAWPSELRASALATIPLGRFGKPDEVSGAAVFLASAEASFITGQTLSVNGGAYMS